eukprot:1079113-Pleurochrysis_carterae.AAC.2
MPSSPLCRPKLITRPMYVSYLSLRPTARESEDHTLAALPHSLGDSIRRQPRLEGQVVIEGEDTVRVAEEDSRGL